MSLSLETLPPLLREYALRNGFETETAMRTENCCIDTDIMNILKENFLRLSILFQGVIKIDKIWIHCIAQRLIIRLANW
jgi:hypothetical protein